MSTSAVTTPSGLTTRFTPRRWLSDAMTWLWHWLRRPWLAIFAGFVGVMLFLSVWQLPQLPGQLVDEQAAAATWLLNTSSAYGIWGNAFLALGLFDVLRSPMLYLLLALLVPTLAAQLADQLGAVDQQRSVQRFPLHTPASAPGERLSLSPARPLFRWRGSVKATPMQVIATLESALPHGFVVKDRAAPLVAAPDGPLAGVESAEAVAPVEQRILALRHPSLQYLRPLLMVGLLTAVAGAWIALAFGWQITAPPLAPGAAFRSANRGLVLQYRVALTTTPTTDLVASLQGISVTVPAAETTQQRVGPATFQVRPSYPGIWIATADGSERLTLPGEAKLRASVGLVFATAGREESLLVPDQGTGLRIVQRGGSDTFVLEVYRSDAIKPVYRAELTPGGQLTIPFAPGDTELIITALPGLQVDVRHLPGLWLVPIGIVLAVAGAAAFVRPSNFLLLQAARWPDENTVVVLQSDHPQIIEELRASLAKLTPPADDDPLPPTTAPSPP